MSEGRLHLRRRLRDSPLTVVVAIAVASALVRFAVALTVRTPIIYPDEYLYTALSRGLGEGHFAVIRGQHESFRSTTAYLAPILMAPLWLLSGVGVAYRLCQALGAVAFATSVFPAYGIARRLGVSSRGSVAVALLTVAVPSGVFTSMLLSEPYAYPIFLLAVFAAVEAIASPSLVRAAGVLTLSFVLCVAGGLQFLYFLPAFLAAYLVTGASSLRAYLVRGAVIIGAAAYPVYAVEARGLVSLNYSAGTLASWLAVNLFAFAIGAGWVVVPGGFAGLWGLMRDIDRRGRAFAILTVFLIGAMLLEATVWSASGQGIYERFAFYGAPLVVIALVWAVEAQTLVRRDVAAVAYVGAVGATLLPVLRPLHGAYDEHSPSLHALSNLTVGGRPAAIIWAPILVVLALLVAWRGATAGWSLIAAAIAICVALSVGSSFAYIRHQPDSAVPHAGAPSGSALVTWQDADPYSVMKTLFWNPAITRVVVIGSLDGLPALLARFEPGGTLTSLTGAPVRGPYVLGPDTIVLGNADPYSVMKALFWNPAITRVVVIGSQRSPDGFPALFAYIEPGGTLTSVTGVPVRGPYVLGPDTTVLGDSTAAADRPFSILRAMPPGVAFGWYKDGYLALVGRIVAAGGGAPSSLAMRLHSPDRIRRTISFRCDGGLRKDITVGPGVRRASLPVKAGEVRECWFGLTRGVPERMGRFNLSVKGAINLHRAPS